MTQASTKAMNTSGVLITVLALQYIVVFGSGAYDLMDCVISMVTGGFAFSYRTAENTPFLNQALLSLILGSSIATISIVSIASIGFEFWGWSADFCTFEKDESPAGFFKARSVFAGLDLIEIASLVLTIGMLIVPIISIVRGRIRS